MTPSCRERRNASSKQSGQLLCLDDESLSALSQSGLSTTHTVTLPYSSSFGGGAQEGIVVVYMYSQAEGDE